MSQRTIEEEQLRQLRLMNSQLNPGPALLKFLLLASLVLVAVFGLFAVFVQRPSRHGKPMFEGTFFTSPCYPGVGVKRDPKCR